MRIGQSTDIHQLVSDRPLILGGVAIENPLGLLGHSDADVLCHAIMEAIIGALGQGDLGSHFPDDDEQYKDADSLELLANVGQLMRKKNYRIGNVDSIVIIEKPRLAPYIAAMRTNIANALQCEETRINIKTTRAEGLGFIGEGKGAVANAVVLLKEKEDE